MNTLKIKTSKQNNHKRINTQNTLHSLINKLMKWRGIVSRENLKNRR